jgi:hypothetical protein
MGLLTKNKTWVDNENLLFNDLNSDFDTIYSGVNGNLDNANIKAGAAIDSNKISGTAVTLAGVETLTNKTITASSNTVSANSLKTTTTSVDVAAAVVPSVGQVLMATDSTHATWQSIPLQLQSITKTDLATSFTHANVLTEEEVTGLRTSIPIVAGGTSCTVKIHYQAFATFPFASTTTKIHVGPSTTYLSNTTALDLYVGNSGSTKNIENFGGDTVVTGLDLTVQNYVSIGVILDGNPTVYTMSATGARCCVIVEVYK